jgi:predicted amidophosphoribosyltransferase
LDKARAADRPPFVIFSDAALRGIVLVRPQSSADLLAIRGIGPAKAEKYGTEVLAIIAEAARVNSTLFSPVPTPPSAPAPDDPVSAFLSRPHPRPLTGPWLAGWALDFHSRFSGADHDRSEVGELAYLYKYRGGRHLARELAARWAELLAAHPELPRPDAVIPIPPSTAREFDPVTALAQALAAQLSIPALADTLVKTRTTKPQKEMTALAQKQANVAGAFALKGDMRGKRLILVDDLYDSGATLAEAARVLARAGVTSLVVLTLTKTIHADA